MHCEIEGIRCCDLDVDLDGICRGVVLLDCDDSFTFVTTKASSR